MSQAAIEVRRAGDADPYAFDVTVREGKGETRHRVTLAHAHFAKLARGAQDASAAGKASAAVTPERVIEAAFRFLLDREPKESILGRFDASVIARYFPEFERELARYLE